MEMAGIASGLISAIVGVAAFVRSEVRRCREQRANQQLLAAIAVGLTAIALVRLLTKQP